MRLLLDTQLIYWWVFEDPKLPVALLPLVEQADEVFVSVISEWELAIKAATGKLRLEIPKFSQGIEMAGFARIDVKSSHVQRLTTLPLFEDHKDPFDRMLIAQSLNEPLTFVTTDRKLARYSPTVTVLP
jgi:PIN domain nuclease of toxin-antitoxin system